jgi:hypothetical protein
MWLSALADADPATTRRIAISHSDHLLASFPAGKTVKPVTNGLTIHLTAPTSTRSAARRGKHHIG